MDVLKRKSRGPERNHWHVGDGSSLAEMRAAIADEACGTGPSIASRSARERAHLVGVDNRHLGCDPRAGRNNYPSLKGPPTDLTVMELRIGKMFVIQWLK
jgi:hypothetical protein